MTSFAAFQKSYNIPFIICFLFVFFVLFFLTSCRLIEQFLEFHFIYSVLKVSLIIDFLVIVLGIML